MVRTLKDHDLSSTEWSLLGVISDETKNGGIRVSDLASLLDVETSFITNMVKKLIKNDYVEYGYDEDDGRVRLIKGTDKCHLKVVEIENDMRSEMRQWLGDVKPTELLQYITVLGKISKKTIKIVKPT
jgi:DNA-binding MarR family transcriptional regulator